MSEISRKISCVYADINLIKIKSDERNNKRVNSYLLNIYSVQNINLFLLKYILILLLDCYLIIANNLLNVRNCLMIIDTCLKLYLKAHLIKKQSKEIIISSRKHAL